MKDQTTFINWDFDSTWIMGPGGYPVFKWQPIDPDTDNDGILNADDKCPGTIDEQITYGCSCHQILDLKPGEDTMENRDGCSEGIIDVFTKAIGWAKDLF